MLLVKSVLHEVVGLLVNLEHPVVRWVFGQGGRFPQLGGEDRAVSHERLWLLGFRRLLQGNWCRIVGLW